MTRRPYRTVFIALILGLIAISSPVTYSAGPPSPGAAAYLQLPLRFERSHDPARAATDFAARGAGYAVRLSSGDATITLKSSKARSDTIRMRLVGGVTGVAGTPGAELPGRSHHIIGRDSGTWRTDVVAYGSVTYSGVYPGIALVFYGSQRQLEYDFVVAPGAAPATISFAIEGAQKLHVDESGDLVITTRSGSLSERAPQIYQETPDGRRVVGGRYHIRPDGNIGFVVGAYDARLPLVIDPVLSYATYLGGANQERIHGVAADAEGNVVIVGDTWSADFPIADAAQSQPSGFGDTFVAKLDATGSALVYATYFGGNREDSAKAVAVDAAGAAYVTGATTSSDFPVINGFQAEPGGNFDTFVFKLGPDGMPAYATLLGGGHEDYGNGIVVGSDGRAHVGGSTLSADFPTVNALQPVLGGYPLYRSAGGQDPWTGSSAGLLATGVTALTIDPFYAETVYAGSPMEGVFRSTDGGFSWAAMGGEPAGLKVTSLAVNISPSGVALLAATAAGVFRTIDEGATWTVLPLSGSATSVAADAMSMPGRVLAGFDSGDTGVFVSDDGGDTWNPTGVTAAVNALAVGGRTAYAATVEGVFVSSDDGTWVPANSGLPSPVRMLAVDSANPSLAYAAGDLGLFKTTTAGASWEPVPQFVGTWIMALAITPQDPLTVYVSTLGSGTLVTSDGGDSWWPTYDSVPAQALAAAHPIDRRVYAGVLMNRDGFVATISADGSTLEYSTYFGGTSHEEITDIALDGNESKVIVGTTSSSDLPLRDPFLPYFLGLQDVFVARIASGGTLTSSTYLGGTGFESAPRVAVDAAGRAYVVGLTWSSTFPIGSAAQPQHGGGYADAFVTVFYPEGSSFVYSTFLGGSGMETDSAQSLGPDVAVTPSGEAYVTGTTMSPDFPITGDALQPVHGGQADAFVTKLDAAGGLLYSTFLGGAGDDFGRAAAIIAQRAVVVGGYTNSGNLPVLNPLQPGNAGTDDGFVATIDFGPPPPDPIETIPPVTAVLLSGTPGQHGWYRSPVEVTLSATDEGGSGVAQTQYRVNYGPLQVYTAPFTVNEEGMTGISAFSTDAAGNVEDAAPATGILIDTVRPTVVISSPTAREYLYTDTVAVSVVAEDWTSGLSGPPAHTLDGTPVTGGSIDLSTLALGPHTLTVDAMDDAGNTTQASVTFRVVLVRDTTINVPAEAPTIQAAIDAAAPGDTVLVAPGTYFERIDFRGKTITVASDQGPEQTIIEAIEGGTVVTFQSGETRASVLRGFTIRGGSWHTGGGISIRNASPTIDSNVVTDNRACTGAGIYSYFSSPLVTNNRITRNLGTECSGGWGLGIYVGGYSSAEIVGNELSENQGFGVSGGGLALYAAGTALVSGNVIKGNHTGCGWGGGIRTVNDTQATLVNNLIVGNHACYGGGIHWSGTGSGSVWVNNTIATNEATVSWHGAYLSTYAAPTLLHNNIIAAHSGPALYCESATAVALNANDVYSRYESPYGGSCSDRTGLDGNISADPAFLNAAIGDFRVGMMSPVIDAGDQAAPHLPATDLSGAQRTFDGDGNGDARVDIGAFEYRNRAPVIDAGPDRTVACGPDCQATVTLTGTVADPDGDPVSFGWSSQFGIASGLSYSVTLPLGSHPIWFTAFDHQGGVAMHRVIVTVVDSVAPTIASIAATPSMIERTNHEMAPVMVSVSASDLCDPSVECRIIAVTSNEPEQGAGDGDTYPDWQITGSLTVNLRAERSGKGNGRVYTLVVECADDAGNRATSSVTVTVPR